ncbi:hypothetical protein EJB05_51905, partial [Eragrostis curvula]
MAPPRQLPALTDDLLDEIFVRIGCPAALTRASAASVAFRRLITDPTFLRRYRTRHRPLLLGFFSYQASEGFHPIEAPHPNAPASRAVASISAVDYLPPNKTNQWFKTNNWHISDIRDGRLLMECDDVDDPFVLLPVYVVCDPLSRTYLMLPPLRPYCGEQILHEVDALFVPCAEKDDETSFRVICTMHYEKNLAVSLFFDSGYGSWTVGKSFSWNALISSNEQESYIRILPRPYYVYGSIYWRVVGMNKLLKLNINAMEFSMVDLPLGHDGPSAIFVEAGEGRLGMFSRTADGKFLNYYCYDSIENEDQRANEWQLKNVIPLHVLDHPRISGASQPYIFLKGNSEVQDSMHTTIYSLDIKTLKIERVNRLSCRSFTGRSYFGFPPWMSPKRI